VKAFEVQMKCEIIETLKAAGLTVEGESITATVNDGFLNIMIADTDNWGSEYLPFHMLVNDYPEAQRLRGLLTKALVCDLMIYREQEAVKAVAEDEGESDERPAV
jgi:hypothetical protein